MTHTFKLVLLIFFANGHCFGQVGIRNISLQRPDSNILYVGIENKLTIKGLHNLADTRLNINGKSFYPSKSNIFYVGMSAEGKTLVRLYKRQKVILKREFLVNRIPYPKIGLGIFADTTLPIYKILNNFELISELPNCILKLNYEIVSFNLTIISKSSDTISQSNRIYSNTIPFKQKGIIGKLKSGDKLIFEEIKVNGPDDIFLKPFYIEVE